MPPMPKPQQHFLGVDKVTGAPSVTYTEKLPDGTVRIVRIDNPTPDDLRRVAELAKPDYTLTVK